MQILGDLRTGLPRAHHQHAAFGQRLRIAVLLGMQLDDIRRQTLGQARDDRRVITARGDDDLIGAELASAGLHQITALRSRADALYRDALTGGSVDTADEAVEVVDDFLALHEPVRVVPGIGVAWQGALPVRRHQAEGIPALGAPAMGEAVLFQQQMVDALLLQVVAGGQTGLPAADDDDLMMGNLYGFEMTGHWALHG